MTFPTVAIANYFIGKAQSEGICITPMKLLKLVYIAHGWHLGLYDRPLIGEEVQAWQYGPVVSSVYHDFKHYGSGNITRQHMISGPDGNPIIPTVTHSKVSVFLDKVWEAYKHYNGWQLSDITHQPGTPWDIVWRQNGGSERRGSPIPQQLIADYYKKLATRRDATRT